MNKYFKFILALVFSGVGVYFAINGENLLLIFKNFLSVDIKPIILATSLLIFSCMIRAYRWKILLQHFAPINFHSVFSSTMIGYFGNHILLFRLGELLKAHSISRQSKITLSQAFGTVILERLLDLLAVLIIFIILLPWFPFQLEYAKLGAITFMMLCTLIVFLIYLLNSNFFSKIGILRKTILWLKTHIVKKYFFSVIEGINVISKIPERFSIFISSIFLWGLYFFVSIILLDACKVDIDMIGAGILMVIGSFALGIPALPGAAGTYDASVKYGLVYAFNISSDIALNYAIISHMVSYFPFLIIGLIYFLISNLSLNILRGNSVNEQL